MMKILIKIIPVLLLIALTMACSNQPKEMVEKPLTEKYVFQTTDLKRYTFPTHANDLIVDRSEATYCETFFSIVPPKTTVFHHIHHDTEQIFYMLEGKGVLQIGPDKKNFPFNPGDVARIPLSTYHSVINIGDDTIKYLCVDCFAETKLEPTWDEHVKVVCQENGWDYNEVVGYY